MWEGILFFICWLSTGIGAYWAYIKYNIMDWDEAQPSIPFFAFCVILAPFHFIIIPSVLLFKKLNSLLGFKVVTQKSFIGNVYKVMNEDLIGYCSLSPIYDNNVIEITSVQTGISDEFSRVGIKRIAKLSSGNDIYPAGLTYLEEIKKAIANGALHELSENEKLLLSIN